MPVIFGYHLRWRTREEPCTACGATQENWMMDEVKESREQLSGDLLCSQCLDAWKALRKRLVGVGAPSPAPEAVHLDTEE